MKILEVTNKLVRIARPWLNELKDTYTFDVIKVTFNIWSELGNFIIKSNRLMRYKKQLLLRELQEKYKKIV